MESSTTQARKRIASLLRLVRRIEESAIEEFRPGYIRNQFGGYDDEKATQKLLTRFEELISEAPDDDYLVYLFAGALARASRYEESVELYQRLSKANGQYADSSAMLLPLVFWLSGDRSAAEAALDNYNAPLLEKGIAPRHERVEQMFGPGHVR